MVDPLTALLQKSGLGHVNLNRKNRFEDLEMSRTKITPGKKSAFTPNTDTIPMGPPVPQQAPIETLSQTGQPVVAQPPVVPPTNRSVPGSYIEGAQRYNIPELNHGTRKGTSGLVVHRTAGRGFHTPNDPRAINGGLGAHLTIDRNGKIHQIGGLDDKMWHAGPGYNGNSVGIELTGKHLGGDKWEPLTELQQSAFLKAGGDVINKYGLTKNDIHNHAAIAAKTAGEGLVSKDYLIANHKWR